MWDGHWTSISSVVIQEGRYIPDGPSHMGDCSEFSITLQAPLIDVKSLLPTHIKPMGVSNGKITNTNTPTEDLSRRRAVLTTISPIALQMDQHLQDGPLRLEDSLYHLV
jgi:hypothetical protein